MNRALLRVLGVLAILTSSTAAEPPLLERQYLTGDWHGMRPALSAHGFEPYLTYTGMLWFNLSGGRDTGAQVNGYLDFGMDVDLTKLGTWDGFGMHADFHWWQGHEPTSELIGGTPAMTLSGWESTDTFRVYNVYLQQAVFADRLFIRLGQIAADTDFMLSHYGSVFLNGAFGDLPSQNLNIDAPVYPLAAPGVFALGRPWPWLTGRFGAYTGDPGDDVAGNHGFEWKLGNNAGYTFFSELTGSPPDPLFPAAYTLGGIYDTGDSGQLGTGVEDSSHYELYLMADQALAMNPQGDPAVGLFARISGSPQSGRNVVGIYADAGLAWFGPLASRPHDVLGAAVSVLRFTEDFKEQARGAGAPVGGGETVIEITYQVAIAPWLVVQPDAQFFFNPTTSRRDAQALGVEVVANF